MAAKGFVKPASPRQASGLTPTIPAAIAGRLRGPGL
jgi:hypothetical protein